MSGGYDGFRGKGVRLAEEQLPHLATHRTELLGDSLPAIHAFDKAHLVMLAEQGVLEAEQARALLRAMRRMEEEGAAAARIRVGGGMHSGEQYLVSELGLDLGGRINTGRSSGDLIEVARRMTIREHVRAILDAQLGLRGVLLDLADQHRGTVMPGYTHGQHAQPTTFGHWLLMWERSLARDGQRLVSLLDRLDLSPAGAAIMTGTDFPISRERTCALLGFKRPLQNTLDAIMSHDLEMEVASVYTIAAATLGRIAEDLFLWTTSEFGFIELPDRYCGTSSIMPQKKNPDALELVKGISAQALGGLVAVIGAERGPTGFPILERRHTQDTLWALGRSLAEKLGDLAGIARDMDVRTAAMADSAGAHWAQVTDLASALVLRTGIGWRESHQVVGAFVRLAVERRLEPAETTPALLSEAAASVLDHPVELAAEDFAAAMDARAFVERRTLLGGPAASAVAAAAVEARAEVAAHRAALDALAARVDGAAAELERAIDALLA